MYENEEGAAQEAAPFKRVEHKMTQWEEADREAGV